MDIAYFPTSNADWNVFAPMTVAQTLANIPKSKLYCNNVSFRNIMNRFYGKDIFLPQTTGMKYDAAIISGFAGSYFWGLPFNIKKEMTNIVVYWDGEPFSSGGNMANLKNIDIRLSHMGTDEFYNEKGIKIPDNFHDLKNVVYEVYPQYERSKNKIPEAILPHPIDENMFLNPKFANVALEYYSLGKYKYLVSHNDEVGLINLKKQKGQRFIPNGRNEELVRRIFEAKLDGKKVLGGSFWEYNPEMMAIINANDWIRIPPFHWSCCKNIFGNTEYVFQFMRNNKKDTCIVPYTERTNHTIALEKVLISDKMVLDDERFGFIDGETYIKMEDNSSAEDIKQKIERNDYSKIVKQAKVKIAPQFSASLWGKVIYDTIECLKKK